MVCRKIFEQQLEPTNPKEAYTKKYCDCFVSYKQDKLRVKLQKPKVNSL
jgi:hypothetical protein